MERTRKGKKTVINPQTGNVIKSGTPLTRFLNRLLTIGFSIVLVIALSIAGLSIVFLVNDVEGSSMMKTLNAHYVKGTPTEYQYDQVVVNKLKQPVPGEIFVIKNFAKGYEEYHIKRLIAVEGDTISLQQVGKYFLILKNGEVLDEPYLDNHDSTCVIDCKIPHWGQMCDDNPFYLTFYKCQTGQYFMDYYSSYPTLSWMENDWWKNGALVVPKGYVFYLGDNRRTSGDSILYGPQPEKNIIGTVVMKVDYPDNLISYYWKQFLKWLGIN